MTNSKAKSILVSHLEVNRLNLIEEIIPFNTIEESYYFRHSLKVVEFEELKEFWAFTLGNQLFEEKRTHESIGPPPLWYVNKLTGHCIYNIFVDDLIIYKDWILKYEIFNSNKFYQDLNKFTFQDNLSFQKAVSLWYQSNILDEYSLLSYLKFFNQIEVIDVSKIRILTYYFHLKRSKEVVNEQAIQKLLSAIPFDEYESEASWKLTKQILELPLEEKLRLHKVTSEKLKNGF